MAIHPVKLGIVAAALVVIPIVASRIYPFPASEKVQPPKASPHCTATVGDLPGRPVAQGCMFDTAIVDQSPSIQVSRSGVLFIGRTAKGVLRSTDNGLNWQEITPPSHANGDSHAKGVHGTVHIDAVTDRVYYVTSNAAASCGPMKGGAVVSWSDDLGKTWDGSTTGCGTYDWGRMITGHHPKGLNQRAVYFFGVAPRLVGGIRPVFRSFDGGATWTKMKNPASVTTEAGAGVAAPDGTLYFDYPEFIGFDPYRVIDQTYPPICVDRLSRSARILARHGGRKPFPIRSPAISRQVTKRLLSTRLAQSTPFGLMTAITRFTWLLHAIRPAVGPCR